MTCYGRVTKRGDYEISQLRPSRYIGVDGVSWCYLSFLHHSGLTQVVQIYSYHLATGNAAFMVNSIA